jgi:putative spermidine/putrescine transport system permease protein
VRLAWLGLVPFAAYAFLFLLLPAGSVMVGAFRGPDGGASLANVEKLFEQPYRDAYLTSIELGLVTALAGGLLGTAIAWAAVGGRLGRWVRPVVTSFSAVAANFAGVPLAFAFVATFGTIGMVTRFLRDTLGIDIYAHGFTLFNFWGLALTYLAFQVPLMILVIAPALDGLRPQWREAAEGLGATPAVYWRRVGIPVLLPSFLGALVLLFGNSFAAYATAYALTSGKVPLVPIMIGAVLSGNVLSDPNFGQALAFGMLVVMVVVMAAYWLLGRRAARWAR